jgi:DNA-binding MarR family transcriptional regulator
MKLTREQEQVLGAIAGLCREDTGALVLISDVHHSFSDMDVSDLVLHLGILLDRGFIRNARPTTEKVSNMYVVTPEGLQYYQQIIKKNS